MLVLSAGEVEALLDLDQLVDAVEAAMVDLSAGRASMPPRVGAEIDGRQAFLAAMPAFLPSANALSTKLVSVFPQNRHRPTHQALICCFDATDGTPLAVLDGTYVTAARTAAGSALATRLLARPEAEVVAVLGTGVQARSHARALGRLPSIARLRVAGRDGDRTRRLVDELTADGIAAEAAPSIEDALRSADVVCAATHPQGPVVQRAWLRPGTHINSVGYNTTGAGEVDLATVRDALVVVESRAAALGAGLSGAVELRRAVEAGWLDAAGVVEIGEISAGRMPGRTDAGQLTLYKSVGVAVQDAAAASLVLDAAWATGIGTEVAI